MADNLEFRLTVASDQFNDAISKAKKSIKGLEESFTKVAKVSSAAFVGLAGSVGLAVNEAAKIETITSQFQVLTGSVLGAQKAVEQLQQFSAATPFSFESVANAGRQLLAFGFEVDQLTPKLQVLGDVAAASGSDIGDITQIFGQVAAAGKLTGERLLQFQERAIPIGPALAKTLGVAESSVRDLVSRGKVDFATFEKAFESLNKQGSFAFGGLDKVSQTLEGRVSTLKDNFSLLAGEFGKQFLPAAKSAVTALTNLFQQLKDNPELIKTAARFTRIALGVTAVVAAIATLAAGIAYILPFIISIGGVVLSLINPFTLTIAALFALGNAFRDTFPIVNDVMTGIENVISGVVSRIKTLFSGLGNLLDAAFKFDVDGIKDSLNEIEAAFLNSTAEMEAQKNQVEENRKARAEREKQEELSKQKELETQEAASIALKEEQRAAELEQKIAEDEAEKERKLEAGLILDEVLTEQRIELNAKEREQLIEHLAQQEDLKTQDLKKELDAKRKQKQQDLKIEQEYGKTYLAFKKALDSESFKNAESLAAQNVNLARSSNSTISGIGKAAAITQIGTDSARGAMAAFSQAVATFPPPFGPAVGAALAAAQIAYGVERIGQVRGAQQGGLVEGIGPGDKNPFMLERGELVVPRKDFDQVVADAAARQEGQAPTGAGGGVMEVVIGFKDSAFEIIEEKILERRDSGVGVI
ncbi:tape measure protein [Candidatus Saccharibacteria bacterium]|nr:tape measure protein [Candidatus Saccharibacteria bacterium]